MLRPPDKTIIKVHILSLTVKPAQNGILSYTKYHSDCQSIIETTIVRAPESQKNIDTFNSNEEDMIGALLGIFSCPSMQRSPHAGRSESHSPRCQPDVR